MQYVKSVLQNYQRKSAVSLSKKDKLKADFQKIRQKCNWFGICSNKNTLANAFYPYNPELAFVQNLETNEKVSEDV